MKEISGKSDIDNKILSIQHVDFSFGKTQVLKDISFSISRGDFLGIIGPNGSGKTTLLKLILGLYPLKKGEIFLCEQNISNFNKWSEIGYVPQKATSIATEFPASVEEVVLMGILAKKSFPKILTKKDKQLATKILKTVSMEKFITTRIGELSGGQQQRVLIAKALISEPKILFLDEPTTGIDPQTQITFYKLLKELNDDGITIVLVSHDIGRITKYVTKVASLNQTMVFYGTHEEFCAFDPAHKHDGAHDHSHSHNHSHKQDELDTHQHKHAIKHDHKNEHYDHSLCDHEFPEEHKICLDPNHRK